MAGKINDPQGLLDITVIGTKYGVGGLVRTKDAARFRKRVDDEVARKKREISEYRRKASRLASVANKRIERLEKNNLTDSPAYQYYIKDGAHRFGVRGKTYNEVQAEVARLQRFLQAKTSTVRGINNHLKEVAEQTGIKYSSMQELREKAPAFFELASKVEQYLREVEDAASAIGYQRIWRAINQYTQDARVDLRDSQLSIEEMVEQISNALVEHQKPTPVSFDGMKVWEGSNWFKMPKD